MHRWFSCFAVLLVGCVVSEQAPAEPPDGGRKGSDWLRFLGPNGNSTSPETGIRTTWPEKGLRRLWELELGEGYGAPAIEGDRLYVFDRVEDSARLRCLQTRNAQEIWRFEYPTKYEDRYSYSNGPRCCPTLDGDRIYLHGSEGMLHCLNKADGKCLWKVDTATRYGIVQNFFGVGSTPLVEGDLLLVQIGGSPPGSDKLDFARIKGNGSAVVAFNKRTGEEVWKVSEELASYASPVVATVAGKKRCFVLARGGLIAFDAATGENLVRFPWRAKAYESVNASNPVIVGEQIFITECYGPGGVLLKIAPDRFTPVWSDADQRIDKSLACHWMTPIHHEGHLYGSSGRHEDAELRCVELATGKVLWSQPDLTRTSLLMVDGHFLCLGEEGSLRLLKVDAKKYHALAGMLIHPTDKDFDPRNWGRRVRSSPFWAAPVLSHGLLYIRGGNYLFCLELIPPTK